MLRSLCIVAIAIANVFVHAQKVVLAGQIAPADQTYDFSPNRRCRLLAHQSLILQNDNHNLLIIDGGFGKFTTTANGSQVQVLDLNPYTVAFDLSKDFAIPGLQPVWQYKKPAGTTKTSITNHGGLWTSQDQNTIWYQGGHYYNSSNWTSSQYHVNKWEIPPWQLWQMDVKQPTLGWKDITSDVKGREQVNRTFAGAPATATNAKKSFWIGGLIDPTTSATTSNDTLQTTDQMLIFDHTNNTITRKKYYYPSSTQGQYQGKMLHLPIGSKSGYLVSLMSLEKPINSPFVDEDGADGNLEVGTNVTLDSIPLYDIDAGVWFEQKTSWYMGQIPAPRTRFCSALFYDEVDKTWSLWVHGGQQLVDQSAGVQDIYVLSMPSFIWSKVETAAPETNLIRSHTCHAVGGHLVMVGGYPPGAVVPTNATCDPQYVKVLKINQDEVALTTTFTAKSQYRTPQTIRNVAQQIKVPMAGFANQKLQDDFQYQPPAGSSNIRFIAGGVIGGVAAIVIVGLLIWHFRRRKLAKAQAEAAAARDEEGTAATCYGQPEERYQEFRQQPTTTIVERVLAASNRGHAAELASPTAHRFNFKSS